MIAMLGGVSRRTWTPGISPGIPSAINAGVRPVNVANDPRPLTPANDTLEVHETFERAGRRESIRGALLVVGLMAVAVAVIIAARIGFYLAANSDTPIVRQLLNGVS